MSLRTILDTGSIVVVKNHLYFLLLDTSTETCLGFSLKDLQKIQSDKEIILHQFDNINQITDPHQIYVHETKKYQKSAWQRDASYYICITTSFNSNSSAILRFERPETYQPYSVYESVSIDLTKDIFQRLIDNLEHSESEHTNEVIKEIKKGIVIVNKISSEIILMNPDTETCVRLPKIAFEELYSKKENIIKCLKESKQSTEIFWENEKYYVACGSCGAVNVLRFIGKKIGTPYLFVIVKDTFENLMRLLSQYLEIKPC